MAKQEKLKKILNHRKQIKENKEKSKTNHDNMVHNAWISKQNKISNDISKKENN